MSNLDFDFDDLAARMIREDCGTATEEDVLVLAAFRSSHAAAAPERRQRDLLRCAAMSDDQLLAYAVGAAGNVFARDVALIATELADARGLLASAVPA